MRIAREWAGLEQDQLADRMGTARSTVSNAENGKGNPRRTTINAWALATGVPAQWLIDGIDPDNGPSGGLTEPSGPTDGLRISSALIRVA
jgi:hypothetical protein